MFILIKKELPFLQGGSFLSNQSHVKNKVSTEVRQKAPRETALSKHFEQRFEINLPCARETLPQSSISNANRVQAQPGDSIKKEGPKTGPSFFGGEGGTHSVTPRLKTVHRTVFPEKAPAFSVGSFESPLLQFDKKRRSQNGTFFFWRRRGDSNPRASF